MDIKAKVDEVVSKLQADPKLMSQFQSDPVKTLEGLTGVDLPDDQINKVVDLVKAKIGVGNLADGVKKFLK